MAKRILDKGFIRVFIICMLIVLVACSIFISTGYSYATKQLLEDAKLISQEKSKLLSQTIETVISNCNNISIALSLDDSMLDYESQSKSVQQEMNTFFAIRKRLETYCNVKSGPCSVFVYYPSKSCVVYDFIYKVDCVDEWFKLPEYTETYGGFKVNIIDDYRDPILNRRYKCAQIIRKHQSSNKDTCIIVNIDFGVFDQLIQKLYENDYGSVRISSINDETLISYNKCDEKLKSVKTELNTKEELSILRWKVETNIVSDVFFYQLNLLRTKMILYSILILIVGVSISYLVAMVIHRPLFALYKSILASFTKSNDINHGRYDSIDSIKSTLEELNSASNQMNDAIINQKRVIQENYVRRIFLEGEMPDRMLLSIDKDSFYRIALIRIVFPINSIYRENNEIASTIYSAAKLAYSQIPYVIDLSTDTIMIYYTKPYSVTDDFPESLENFMKEQISTFPMIGLLAGITQFYNDIDEVHHVFEKALDCIDYTTSEFGSYRLIYENELECDYSQLATKLEDQLMENLFARNREKVMQTIQQIANKFATNDSIRFLQNKNTLEQICKSLQRFSIDQSVATKLADNYPSVYTKNDLKLIIKYICEQSNIIMDKFDERKAMKGQELAVQAMCFIDENFSTDITVDKVAAHCCISESYLYKIMNDYCGESPAAYLASVRLKHAEMMLLGTNLQIKDIAQQCGFANIQMLNRLFRKRNNCSPKEYRECEIVEKTYDNMNK